MIQVFGSTWCLQPLQAVPWCILSEQLFSASYYITWSHFGPSCTYLLRHLHSQHDAAGWPIVPQRIVLP